MIHITAVVFGYESGSGRTSIPWAQPSSFMTGEGLQDKANSESPSKKQTAWSTEDPSEEDYMFSKSDYHAISHPVYSSDDARNVFFKIWLYFLEQF